MGYCQNKHYTVSFCARVNHAQTDITTQPLYIRSFEEIVKLKDKVTIRPFETSIVKARTDTIMTGGRLHVLVHLLDAKNNKLPNGLEVSAMYTDLKRGSKSMPVVLSSMTEQLGDDDVKCLLDGITIGATNHAELHNPLLQQAEIEDNIQINVARLTNTNTEPKGEINVVDWAQAQ